MDMLAIAKNTAKKLRSLLSQIGKRGARTPSQAKIEQAITTLAALTNRYSNPNINKLWELSKDLNAMRLNTKNFGYELALKLAPGLSQINTASEPREHNLVSKATTQSDIESPWFVYWCNQIKCAPIYHRKLWEFAFTLQALHERNYLTEGSRAIGFGCGEEPLASYFAQKGIQVTVTDLHPDKVAGMGWAETGQHTLTIDKSYYPDIVGQDQFNKQVEMQYVDMNNIPDTLTNYDFCWSICALEHLGSIKAGLTFIEESLKCLKPGGLAVHTTEFNYLSNGETIDNWPTVLFRQSDFEALKSRLEQKGHTVIGIDYGIGNQPVDRFIDVPPYAFGEGWLNKESWDNVNQAAHLKLNVDGFPCTCIGLLIVKGTR
jgi:2-polyprenyl-3-methyl-5-hydroxy-6-metoxy-1,4-benzoquinol methylase